MAERAGSKDHPWRPIRGTRASEEIVSQIREAFFEGMMPGDWLGTEVELAERFGVSRITFRDAIRSLEAQGIVAVRVGARGGLRIADSDPDRYADALSIQLHLMGITWQELTEAMRAVEVSTAGLAARNASEEDVARLRRLTEEAKAGVDDPARFTSLALDFHLAVAEAAGNRAIRAFLRSLRSAQHHKFEANTSHELAARVARMHGDIIDAIAAGDADLAQKRMDDHLALVVSHPDKATDADQVCVRGS